MNFTQYISQILANSKVRSDKVTLNSSSVAKLTCPPAQLGKLERALTPAASPTNETASSSYTETTQTAAQPSYKTRV